MGRSGTVGPLIPPGNGPGGDRLEAAPVGGVHSSRSPCAGHPVTCLAGSGPWSPHSGVQGLFAQRPAGLRPPGCPGLSCCEVSAQVAWSRSSPPGSLPCPRGCGSWPPDIRVGRGQRGGRGVTLGGHALVPRACVCSERSWPPPWRLPQSPLPPEHGRLVSADSFADSSGRARLGQQVWLERRVGRSEHV